MMLKGFSHIEFLVYFCIFALFIPVVLRYVVTTCLSLKQEQQNLERNVSFLQALDTVQEHLQKAPAQFLTWKKLDEQTLIWHDAVQNIDKGICWIKNKLWYITGTYISLAASWKKKHKELLASECSVSFKINKKTIDHIKHVVCIACTIKNIDEKKEKYTAFYTNVIPLEGRIFVYEK